MELHLIASSFNEDYYNNYLQLADVAIHRLKLTEV